MGKPWWRETRELSHATRHPPPRLEVSPREWTELVVQIHPGRPLVTGINLLQSVPWEYNLGIWLNPSRLVVNGYQWCPHPFGMWLDGCEIHQIGAIKKSCLTRRYQSLLDRYLLASRVVLLWVRSVIRKRIDYPCCCLVTNALRGARNASRTKPDDWKVYEFGDCPMEPTRLVTT